MKYTTLDNSLQGRNHDRRKLANNTYAERRENGAIAIRLHTTDILTFQQDGKTIIDTKGWQTTTTKSRLNEFLPCNGINQRGGIWYWNTGQKFSDGDKIGKRGGLHLAGNGKTETGQKKLLKEINIYAKKCADALPLEPPSGGDCWMCLGMFNSNTGHLESHMEEGYAVPTLVLTALQQNHAGNLIISGAFTQDKFTNDLARDYVKRAVRKFMKKQFGLPA